MCEPKRRDDAWAGILRGHCHQGSHDEDRGIGTYHAAGQQGDQRRTA